MRNCHDIMILNMIPNMIPFLFFHGFRVVVLLNLNELLNLEKKKSNESTAFHYKKSKMSSSTV